MLNCVCPQQADKVASDVGSAVNNVLEKVEKLRAAREKKDQVSHSSSPAILFKAFQSITI